MKKFKNRQRPRRKYGTDLISYVIKKPKKSGETVPLTRNSIRHAASAFNNLNLNIK